MKNSCGWNCDMEFYEGFERIWNESRSKILSLRCCPQQGRLEKLPHPLIPPPDLSGWITQNCRKAFWKFPCILYWLMCSILIGWFLYCVHFWPFHFWPLPCPREPVLALVESLRCRARGHSWGSGQILERWTHSQPWRGWVAIPGL